MRFRAVGPLLAGLVLAALLGGCVSPAPTAADYAARAVTTAQAVVSAARTAVLAADTFGRDRLPATYLEPVLEDAEETIGSVRNTFGSIQPPATDAADALRAELEPLLTEAAGAVTDLRIAARRDRPDELASAADDLREVADRLESFAVEHQP